MEGNPRDIAEALLAEGRVAEALVHLEPLIAEGRAGPLTLALYGRARAATGDLDTAFETLREAALLAPDALDVALAFGEVELRAARVPAAIAQFQRALRLDPNSGQTHLLLARAWADAGEAEKAEAHLSEATKDPHHDKNRAAALLREIEGLKGLTRASAPYVRQLFDQFAGDYDERMLGPLAYRAPAILRELLSLVAVPVARLAILDLGCGTGLGGDAFADCAARLVGIDLSPAMLEKARARGIYETLECADIETALEKTTERFDVVLAADVFVYMGDLTRVICGAARVLREGGFLLFTVEASDSQGFELGKARRYRHSADYLRAEAAKAGLSVVGLMDCTPRLNAQIPVAGYAVALRR